MRGRKPKPSKLKLIAGNPGGRKLNKDEPIPSGYLFEPPEWMSKEQKVGWAIAIEHAPHGLLKKLDGSALAIFIVAEDLHRQACIAVEKFGMITKSPIKGDPVQNPYLPIINKQAQIMIKTAAELGFTPSSRSRVTLGADDGKKNKFSNIKARTKA